MKERARPHQVPALYAGIILAAALAAFYLKIIIPYILFPADLLMWGETEFVGNVIRLRGGQPLYSAIGDLNSSVYPPLASIVTYAIARTMQLPLEVPTFRFIQLGFVALSAGVGLVCWRMLRKLLVPARSGDHTLAWSALLVITLFLAATAPATGNWVHALHTDAFVLLWSIVNFALLIGYLSRPSLARLVLLAAAPAIGFAIKQYTLIWAPIAFLTLLIDDHRKIGRLVQLTILTTILTSLGVWISYLLWGNDYLFWVFQVMGGARSSLGFDPGGFELSLPRAADHLLRAWGHLGLGLIGGWILLTRAPSRRAAALWTPWLLLVATEALTSGTGWDALYHFGPGVVIGTIWLFVVLPEVWPETSKSVRLNPVVRSAWAIVGLIAVFVALRTVPSGNRGHQRYWNQTPPPRAYVHAIEAEFDGYAPSDVLMDWGNWVYLRTNHLARDRGYAMAELPTGGQYQNPLEPLLERIRTRRYKKIIVHRYHGGLFVYDWRDLDRPTGIRAALQENYDEVRTIEGPPAGRPGPLVQYAGPVSVLVPKRDRTAPPAGASPRF